MKFIKASLLSLLYFTIVISCDTSGDPEPPQMEDPEPEVPTNTDTTTTETPTNPEPVVRPDFLPEGFDFNASCLFSTVRVQASAAGQVTNTLNTYTYDEYGRYTSIKSETEGLAGFAETQYIYKDSEKLIEIKFTGFEESENYEAVAELNDDFYIAKVNVTSTEESFEIIYFYDDENKLIRTSYDGSLRSFETIYTHGEKGVIKAERVNYVAKLSTAPSREDVVLEWTFGDIEGDGYTPLVLGDPAFPAGYLGNSSKFLPTTSTVLNSTEITSPVAFQFDSNSKTEYTYTLDDKKVIKIESESQTTSNGFSIDVQTIIEIEYQEQ